MIGKDTMYIKLNNDLYYFEEQRRKKRPAVYWTAFLLCSVLGLSVSWLFLERNYRKHLEAQRISEEAKCGL